MTNIKTYQDGNRTIIVIENCTGELAHKTGQCLSYLMGIAELPEITPVPVKGLNPIQVQDEPVDITDLPETDAESLLHETSVDEEELHNRIIKYGISEASKTLALTDDATAAETCKEYIWIDLQKRPVEPTADNLLRLAQDYKLLLDDMIKKKILNAMGYESIDHFAAYASKDILSEAYEAMKKYLESLC